MAGVEQPNVLTSQFLHHPADGAGVRLRGQQVHVVHQVVGMRVVAASFGVVQKAEQTAVAAPYDVLRNAGPAEAGRRLTRQPVAPLWADISVLRRI